MKSLVQAVTVAGVLAAPVASFAQSKARACLTHAFAISHSTTHIAYQPPADDSAVSESPLTKIMAQLF